MTNPDSNPSDRPVGIHQREQNVANDNARPPGTIIDTIVIHADASPKAASTVNWIEDDASEVSYHTFIERDGDVHRFVEPQRRAWHAGKSSFRGRTDVNDFSLGLAFANRNDGVEPYTELQYQVGAAEAAAWIRKYPAITMTRITTHAEIAPDRKTDPGPRFDIAKFKRYVQNTLDGIVP